MNAYEWRERDGEYRFVPTHLEPHYAWDRAIAWIDLYPEGHVVTFSWVLGLEGHTGIADLDDAMVVAETTLRKYATGLLMSLTLVGTPASEPS